MLFMALLVLCGAQCPAPFNGTIYNMDYIRRQVWMLLQSQLSNYLDCYVYGSARTGEAVFMNLQSYALENTYDYVYVLDGKTSSSPRIAAITGTTTVSTTYCGSGPALGIYLFTDSSSIMGGLTLAVWTQGWYCSGNVGGAQQQQRRLRARACCGRRVDRVLACAALLRLRRRMSGGVLRKWPHVFELHVLGHVHLRAWCVRALARWRGAVFALVRLCLCVFVGARVCVCVVCCVGACACVRATCVCVRARAHTAPLP